MHDVLCTDKNTGSGVRPLRIGTRCHLPAEQPWRIWQDVVFFLVNMDDNYLLIELFALRCIWLDTWSALDHGLVYSEHKTLGYYHYYYCCYSCYLVLVLPKECPNLNSHKHCLRAFISTHLCQNWVLSFLSISLFANLIGKLVAVILLL